jgi:nucleotide-binding universal stress UspA family protein
MTKWMAGLEASPTKAGGDPGLEKQSLDKRLIGPVLVATDLTPASDEALRQGDALARALGGPLHMCHVVPDLLTVRMLFPQDQRGDDAFVRELEHHAVDLVQASIAKHTARPRAEVRTGIESGSPHSGILRRAETMAAGVIVVGPGHVAERVVRHAPCPVLVARPSPRGAVLAATDFSDFALPVMTAGAAEAARRDVALVVLHSIDLAPVSAMTAGGAYPMTPPIGAYEDLRVRLRAETLDRLRRGLDSVGAKAETIVADDAPGDAIVAAARTLPAELVVVGTIGRTGLSRLALGSVAKAVVRSAPCSVLVMRLHRSWPDPGRQPLRNSSL